MPSTFTGGVRLPASSSNSTPWYLRRQRRPATYDPAARGTGLQTPMVALPSTARAGPMPPMPGATPAGAGGGPMPWWMRPQQTPQAQPTGYQWGKPYGGQGAGSMGGQRPQTQANAMAVGPGGLINYGNASPAYADWTSGRDEARAGLGMLTPSATAYHPGLSDMYWRSAKTAAMGDAKNQFDVQRQIARDRLARGGSEISYQREMARISREEQQAMAKARAGVDRAREEQGWTARLQASNAYLQWMNAARGQGIHSFRVPTTATGMPGTPGLTPQATPGGTGQWQGEGAGTSGMSGPDRFAGMMKAAGYNTWQDVPIAERQRLIGSTPGLSDYLIKHGYA